VDKLSFAEVEKVRERGGLVSSGCSRHVACMWGRQARAELRRCGKGGSVGGAHLAPRSGHVLATA
jgi:hypothetical protein